MNTHTLIAALALTVAAAAPGIAAAAPAMQDLKNMPRVEVNADMSMANHAYAARGEAYSESIPVSTQSRAEVVAQLHAARAEGLLEQRNELYGSFIPSQIQSTMSRASVMAQSSISASRFEQQYAGA